jgi:hypothetical protein
MAFDWLKKKKEDSKSEAPNYVPDFSHITSNDLAKALFEKNELVKVHLMPLEFGGEDSPLNTLYAPAHARQLKARFDAMVEKLLSEGKNLGYKASPEYKGASFIPSALQIKVSGDVDLSETIHIW